MGAVAGGLNPRRHLHRQATVAFGLHVAAKDTELRATAEPPDHHPRMIVPDHRADSVDHRGVLPRSPGVLASSLHRVRP